MPTQHGSYCISLLQGHHHHLFPIPCSTTSASAMPWLPCQVVGARQALSRHAVLGLRRRAGQYPLQVQQTRLILRTLDFFMGRESSNFVWALGDRPLTGQGPVDLGARRSRLVALPTPKHPHHPPLPSCLILLSSWLFFFPLAPLAFLSNSDETADRTFHQNTL